MSHEVVFLPHILGQTWAQALAAARTAAREEDPRIVAARLEPWPDLVLHAAQILGQIEEYRGRGQRELVHPVTRLRFTFFGEDGVIALPYWYDGPVARMAATMAFRFAHAVEADTGLAAYDPQQRTPLAEMGLEKFVAGYLRGREKALDQPAARGPVPVGHELPTGRSASRRELAAAPQRKADARPGPDAGRPRREAKPVPRQSADQRPAPDARQRRGENPVRGEEGTARPRKTTGKTTGGNPDQRPRSPRDEGTPGREKTPRPRKSAEDSGRAPGAGWLRRGGKTARAEQPQRPAQAPEPRKAPRRGDRSAADQSQRPRKPQRGDAQPGSEWVPRPGSPEPRDGMRPDPARRQRSGQPPQSGQPRQSGQPPRRGELRRVGEPPEPRRAPQPDEPSGGQAPVTRRRPPELPKGR